MRGILGSKDHANPRRALFSWAAWSAAAAAALSVAIVEDACSLIAGGGKCEGGTDDPPRDLG